MSHEASPLLPKSNRSNDTLSDHGGISWLIYVLGFGAGLIGLIVISVFLRHNAITSVDKPIYRSRIYAMSINHNAYIRVDVSDLVLTEPIPWAHGSHLEMHYISDKCFHLRSLKGGWIGMDKNNLKLSANVDISIAESFEFVVHNQQESTQDVGIKVCNQDLYWNVQETRSHKHNILKVIITKPSQDESIVNRKLNIETNIKHNELAPSFENGKIDQNIAIFRIEQVIPVHGVNLGGWFIPEIWMNPSFSNYTNLGWAGSLCSVVQYNRSLAEAQMQDHLSTWITEQDIAEIAAAGFNSIRLPIGYWNIIPDPYELFVPAKVEDSIYYIDWLFEQCSRYNISILLDLHGLPGSQNGIDHSGCTITGTNWLENSDNIELTLSSIETVLSRYSHHIAFYGIELANEPALKYCQDIHNMKILQQFYQDSYQIIRNYSSNCMIVFNELYENCYKIWKHKLQEPNYYNVLIDLHLYNWQEPYTKQSIETHINNAKEWEDLILDISKSHPVLVGEWCFSTGTYVQAGQDFVNACVDSFERAAGWYIWTWKVEKDISFDEWNVQLQYTLPDGLRSFE